MPLAANNVESELSYAYLHAVAAHAGMECIVAGRHSDGTGIDARVHALGNFGGPITDITLEIQLKATMSVPCEREGFFSFPLPVKAYDNLRKDSAQCQRLLVVLFLPEDAAEWLDQCEEKLAIRRCAYWASLRGAPPSTNLTSQTVYLPTGNIFNAAALAEIIRCNSQDERIHHAA